MPITHFQCPDKVEVPISECLVKCRLGQRCLTKPTLLKIAQSERPLSNTPSTTQMLNGPLQEFLKHTVGFSVDPQSRAYALLGTGHHEALSNLTFGGDVAEERFHGDGTSGQPDLLEPDEENPGFHVLTDYKTYGSYRVMKIMGLVKKERRSTTEFYKTNSKYGRKGEPKREVYFEADPEAVDMTAEQLQLNHYRILCEEKGYKVSRMQIQVTVRDGGLMTARQRGLHRLMYLIEIPILDNWEVMSFFEARRDELNHAFSTGEMPRLCNSWESWDKRKCQQFCDVARFCPQGVEELATQGAD